MTTCESCSPFQTQGYKRKEAFVFVLDKGVTLSVTDRNEKKKKKNVDDCVDHTSKKIDIKK